MRLKPLNPPPLTLYATLYTYKGAEATDAGVGARDLTEHTSETKQIVQVIDRRISINRWSRVRGEWQVVARIEIPAHCW